MIRAYIGDILGLVFVVAIIFILVRPRSHAAELVDAVGGMLVKIVRRATDLAAV